MSRNEDEVWLQELSWPDFEAYLESADNPTVVVPIGSTEQHGPHLPLGVDAYQAKDVAEGIAERADVVAAPPIWYGDAEHHMAFPGTIALSSETVISVLSDVYESLARHGVENVLTVNGHRLANLPAIDIASKRVREEHPEVFFATVDLVRIGVRSHNELRDGDPEDGMHGGEFETSFMLHEHPDLVDEDEFVKETHDGWTRFTSNDYVSMDDSVGTASVSADWGEDDLGHHGDPTKASAEKGETLLEDVVDNAIEFLEDLYAHRSGDGSIGLSY
ncbi:creatininase family protein [Halopenitus persicus]|uniref:creatininase family protein n=1 Tax=Halopenitus persicus TaxID=1048396 RepID=UPI000BBACD48|nr:creatininase family protein [Halopenitus persicus]